jgi:hypothetical protein
MESRLPSETVFFDTHVLVYAICRFGYAAALWPGESGSTGISMIPLSGREEGVCHGECAGS